MIEPTLYGRMYRHLYGDMKNMLGSLRHGFLFVLCEVDIDSDPALETRFNELVPVLITGAPETPLEDARELCHYLLDIQAVQAWLTAQSAHN